MAETAEDLATEFRISRAEQDAWAARSQQLYAAALKDGHYADEIVAVGDVSADEHPRPDVNQISLGTLKPIFDAHGTVTAGNSSGINDGAAMILLASESAVEKNGWTVMAEWQDATVVGCDPQRMGLGPVHAIQKLLDRTRLTLQDIDTLEINEAFAAQTLACIKRLEITLPSSQPDATTGLIGQHSLQLNPHGGAIAIGHPLAASGARLLTHLAWQIARNHSTRAIASLCIGGGMGIAALLTAPGPMD
jgi:acetyl-CoA C-acetyltransferase